MMDWLDASCWGCGTDEVALDADGRLLCSVCRAELLDPADDAADPLRVSRRAYWESHALQCCWRCMAGAVDRDDEVGLCSSCRRHLESA